MKSYNIRQFNRRSRHTPPALPAGGAEIRHCRYTVIPVIGNGSYNQIRDMKFGKESGEIIGLQIHGPEFRRSVVQGPLLFSVERLFYRQGGKKMHLSPFESHSHAMCKDQQPLLRQTFVGFIHIKPDPDRYVDMSDPHMGHNGSGTTDINGHAYFLIGCN